MEVLTLVVNDTKKVDELLATLYENGIRGGTVLDSTGMTHVLADHDEEDDTHHFGILREYLNPGRSHSKTIFFVNTEEVIAKIEKIIQEVLGDFSNKEHDYAFMFVVPVTRISGN